jgi:hypothetical protein
MTNELRRDRTSMQDPMSSSTCRPTSTPTRPRLAGDAARSRVDVECDLRVSSRVVVDEFDVPRIQRGFLCRESTVSNGAASFRGEEGDRHVLHPVQWAGDPKIRVTTISPRCLEALGGNDDAGK